MHSLVNTLYKKVVYYCPAKESKFELSFSHCLPTVSFDRIAQIHYRLFRKPQQLASRSRTMRLFDIGRKEACNTTKGVLRRTGVFCVMQRQASHSVISREQSNKYSLMKNDRMSHFKELSVITVMVCAVMLVTACGNGAAHFTIEAKDNLTFTPDMITVKPGQAVELTLVNSGRLDHTFSIPDLNIEVQMPGGATTKFTFTAPKTGEYQFSSGVIRDFETMKGKLIVK